MKGRRAYLKNPSTSLPDTHPDAWTTAYITNEARDTAVFTGEGVVFGREVLFFMDAKGQKWANLLINHSWAEEEVSARSNRDLEQEEQNRSSEWVHKISS